MYSLIFIIIQFICIINAQIYDRIPLWEVEHHILEFVHDNYLHNCYKHTGINEIKLKCMNNKILYDVNINIKTNFVKHDPYENTLV